MPVRKIRPNYRSTTASVSTNKMNRPVGAESSLERDFLVILDFDVNVLRFEEQPLTIEFEDEKSCLHRYTPDFLVYYRADIVPAQSMKPLLCEIKYRKDLFANWKILKPKFKAARAFAKENEWEFRIITEHEIRTPYLKNAKFLRPFRNQPTNWEYFEILTGMLNEFRVATPQAILAAYSDDKLKQAEILPSLWQMVANRIVKTDLTVLLTMRSEIWSAD